MAAWTALECSAALTMIERGSDRPDLVHARPPGRWAPGRRPASPLTAARAPSPRGAAELPAYRHPFACLRRLRGPFGQRKGQRWVMRAKTRLRGCTSRSEQSRSSKLRRASLRSYGSFPLCRRRWRLRGTTRRAIAPGGRGQSRAQAGRGGIEALEEDTSARHTARPLRTASRMLPMIEPVIDAFTRS